MESGKTVQTNLFPGQKQRCRRREMDMWTQKGEGEAGANWKVRTDLMRWEGYKEEAGSG